MGDKNSKILGIESSCDETAAAIVSRQSDGSARILSNIVLSQIDEHSEFGGVVPEIAARAHLDNMDHVVEHAMREADCGFDDLHGIAVTAGPGLIGGLMVGLMNAKGLCAATGLPLLCVNHLEGHALTARLTENIAYPYLLLLVSGGHSQILLVKGLGQYERWASTIDDAVGEAFDKTAKLLSLGFPGGPLVELAAKNGDPKRFSLPHPLKGKSTLNMSFSGLKTAVRNLATEHAPLNDKDVADICAALQNKVSEILADRCARAMDRFEVDIENSTEPLNLVVAGGVAANSHIRNSLAQLCEMKSWHLALPPLDLCTDNGAMIAYAGLERFEAGYTNALDFSARSRWPLDEGSEPLMGHGRRGAKA